MKAPNQGKSEKRVFALPYQTSVFYIGVKKKLTFTKFGKMLNIPTIKVFLFNNSHLFGFYKIIPWKTNKWKYHTQKKLFEQNRITKS